MIPYDLDPSLHDAEPPSPLLDDGFSAPQAPARRQDEPTAQDVSTDPALWAKSPF